MKKTTVTPSLESLRTFKPHIEILLGIQIRPLFAAQMVRNKCSMPMPLELQNQPLGCEITKIKGICRDYIDEVLSENLSKHIIGFKYHRKHNYYMKFDCDFILDEKVFIQPKPPGKVLFGNRVFDMLSGGAI